MSFVRFRSLARAARLVEAAVAMVFLITPPALAQPPGATLTGMVSDESGGAVAGVTLRLSDDSGGVQRTAISDASGFYVFSGVPAGSYVLTGGSRRFAPVRVSGISLASGDQRSLPLTLKMAPLEETVSVQAAGGYSSGAVIIGRTAQSLREIPQSVSVITRERMDDQTLLSLEDALGQSTGITVVTDGPGSGPIYARGFQVDTFQFDGVPQLDSGASFSKPDLALYDRVEVLRGSAGLLQGSGNPAAAINLVRKRPTKQFSASATVYAGSWDNYRTEIDLGGRLTKSGRLRGRAVAAYEDRDYFIDVAQSQKYVLYGITEFDLTTRTLLSGGIQTQRYDAVPLIRGVPRYSDGRPLPLPRSTYLAPEWNDWQLDQTQAFASLEHHWTSGWRVKTSLERAWLLWDAKRTFTQGTDGSARGVNPATNAGVITSGAVRHENTDRYGADANASGPLSLFGRTHMLLAGANVRRYRSLGLTGANLAAIPIENVLNFSPASVPEPGNPPYTGESLYDPLEYGVYGSGRFRVTAPLTVILGGRVDWYDLLSTSRNYASGITTVSTDQRLDGHVTPYAGVVLDLNKAWSAYGSYTSIFSPQLTRFTSTGELLAPVEGNSYEAGVKGELAEGRVNASFAVFRIDQENRAQVDPLHPCDAAAGPSWCYVPDGRVRSQGVEAEVSGEWRRGLQVFAGYTYNTSRYLRDATNQGLTFMTLMPQHLLRVWTQYQFQGDWRRLALGAGVNAQGRFYQQVGTVRAQQDAYAIVNARVAYQLAGRASLSLNGNNLLDQHYFANVGVSGSNLYGDPRNLTLTLRTSF